MWAALQILVDLACALVASLLPPSTSCPSYAPHLTWLPLPPPPASCLRVWRLGLHFCPAPPPPPLQLGSAGHGSILSYSCSRGAFVGISLEVGHSSSHTCTHAHTPTHQSSPITLPHTEVLSLISRHMGGLGLS